MKLVQITDTHIEKPGRKILNRYDTAENLVRAIDVINEMEPLPDLVLHTGDIASHGAPERYALFKEIAAELRMPLRLMTGNHDDRQAMREAFSDTDWLPVADDRFLQYVIDDHPVRIVCCDSQDPGNIPGTLCRDRLAWIEARLDEEPEKPTIVALHHPPFYSGMTGSSSEGLIEGGPELDDLLRRHPQVTRVLAGHAHRAFTTQFGGTIAFVAPTTAFPFGLDTGPDRVLNIVNEPPGIAVHLWLENATPSGPELVSHVLPIGEWDPPITIMQNGEMVV